MTAASTPLPARMTPVRRRPGLAVTRLLRLELRHNAMLWMLPVAIALFWLTTYRKTMAMPPLWNMRARALQSGALLAFASPVAGAAAWMGSRDGRRDTAELVSATARSRWAGHLVTWLATTTSTSSRLRHVIERSGDSAVSPAGSSLSRAIAVARDFS